MDLRCNAGLTKSRTAMRHQGRLSDWNDDKGFGFVVPNGGGERSFVHIKAFERRPQRPSNGVLISYEIRRDARGRLNAVAVRVVAAGKPVPASRPAKSISRLPRKTLGALVLLATAASWQGKILPDWMLLLVTGMSLAALVFYLYDKNAAQHGHRRTPENTLHLIALLGGWPGALIAQGLFRHKTSKHSFQIVFWLTVVVNVIGMAWLIGINGRIHLPW